MGGVLNCVMNVKEKLRTQGYSLHSYKHKFSKLISTLFSFCPWQSEPSSTKMKPETGFEKPIKIFVGAYDNIRTCAGQRWNLFLILFTLNY